MSTIFVGIVARDPADLWTGKLRSQRLEIKVYLSFNQQNSDKMELLQLAAANTVSTFSTTLYLATSSGLPPLYFTLSQ